MIVIVDGEDAKRGWSSSWIQWWMKWEHPGKLQQSFVTICFWNLACGDRAGLRRWPAGFLCDIPFPPPFHSDAAPYSPQSPSSALKPSISVGMKRRGKWETPEKTRRPTASSGTIRTCESPASVLIAQPPWPLKEKERCVLKTTLHLTGILVAFFLYIRYNDAGITSGGVKKVSDQHATRIREDPGSTPGPAILASPLHGFTKSLQANGGVGPKQRPYPTPRHSPPPPHPATCTAPNDLAVDEKRSGGSRVNLLTPSPRPFRRAGINPRPGHSRIFACGNRTVRCRWSVGFLGDTPLPQPFHSSAAPYINNPHRLSILSEFRIRNILRRFTLALAWTTLIVAIIQHGTRLENSSARFSQRDIFPPSHHQALHSSDSMVITKHDYTRTTPIRRRTRDEVSRDGASCLEKQEWGRNRPCPLVRNDPQHPPRVIPGNHGKSKSRWPYRYLYPGTVERATTRGDWTGWTGEPRENQQVERQRPPRFHKREGKHRG
ncbi:hypothetical protein PR048_032393 [Dryococelus australis]|uniref:Uncharacterized protein n=1 Tax=Dryococelus australis TaxID=614101 RepID=A0ABQ9G681_9NEOP|nr:hypothetical protein PR048_032393 [Dryococelus australis]